MTAVLQPLEADRKLPGLPLSQAQVTPQSSEGQPSGGLCRLLPWLLLIVLPLALHALMVAPAEPVFGGDSNRHTMTSVFFRDFLTDQQWTQPKLYAERYYEQYPALGLLVWPPLFHGFTGLAMTILGTTSVAVPRAIVFLCYLVCAFTLYRLLRPRFDSGLSLIATTLFAVSPLTFEYSRFVMLEIPTLALCLLSLQQFDRWLRDHRPYLIYTSAALAALAALTRFDAVVLLPTFGLLVICGRHWCRLASRHVAAAVCLAVVITAPTYAVILSEAGDLHLQQAVSSVGVQETDDAEPGFLQLHNFTYYLSCLPEQVSWPVSLFFVVGWGLALNRRLRRQTLLFQALLVATWLVFTPLAELRSRHAIYWIPAVCCLATLGAAGVLQWSYRWLPLWLHRYSAALVYGVLLISPAVASAQLPAYRVTGYQQAAEYVLQNSSPGDRVFFDGWWDGNFTYYLRSLDASRSRHVIRGDRLLYDFTCVPDTDFQQFVETSDELRKTLLLSQPRYVVLEQPQFYHPLPIGEQLRAVIADHPERFVLVKAVPVISTLTRFPPFHLAIYRVQDAPESSSESAGQP